MQKEKPLIIQETMSACFRKNCMSGVREWHTVTVASIDWRICATGMPTIFDLLRGTIDNPYETLAPGLHLQNTTVAQVRRAVKPTGRGLHIRLRIPRASPAPQLSCRPLGRCCVGSARCIQPEYTAPQESRFQEVTEQLMTLDRLVAGVATVCVRSSLFALT